MPPLIYTQPSELESLVPHKLADELRETVEAACHALGQIPQPLVSRPLGAGPSGSVKWSAKQVIGHLIDSCANNLQRFVRLQIEPEIHLPGYKQEEWVSVQRYDLLPWMQALETWRVLNMHLAHVVQHIDREHLGHVWHTDEGPLTLGFLVEDYIAHMKHHLRQLPVYQD